MDSSKKIVTNVPLAELWDANGEVVASRGEQLDDTGVRGLLSSAETILVVADVGSPLRWLAGRARFEFWKQEVAPRLAPISGSWDRDAYPGGYFYVATGWSSPGETDIISFEKYHYTPLTNMGATLLGETKTEG